MGFRYNLCNLSISEMHFYYGQQGSFPHRWGRGKGLAVVLVNIEVVIAGGRKSHAAFCKIQNPR